MENVFGLMALIIFGFIVIAIGVFGARVSKKTAVDYLLAGREIGIFVMFFYVAFVIYSAWTFYGYPGFLYLSGPPYMMFALAAHIAFSFIYFGIGPRIWAMGKMYELVSPLEFLEGRYESKAVRTITAIVLTLFIIPYIGLQCVGSAVGFKAVFDVPFYVGALYVAILMVVLVVLGGMRSVAWANVFFGVLFFGSLLIAVIWVVTVALPNGLPGAADTILARNPEALSAPGPMKRWTPLNIFGLTLAGLTTMMWPHVIIGTMTARNIRVMRAFALLLPTLGGMIFYALPTLFGTLIGPALKPGLVGKQADAIVQIVIHEFLPYWFSVFVLMAVLAAVMSTVGTQLMTGGIFISRDIISKKDVAQPQLILWTRWALIGVVLLSLGLSFLRPVELGLFLDQIASPGFTQWIMVCLGGLFWKRANKYGAIAGISAGTIFLIAGFLYPPLRLGLPSVVVPTFVNIIVFVVVSLLTPPVSSTTIKKYFDDVDNYLLSISQKKDKPITGISL